MGDNARSDGNTFVQFQSEQEKTLVEAAVEIQQLLKQLEHNNPNDTETYKIAYINDETTPSFKRRVVRALQASGETAIDKFILENTNCNCYDFFSDESIYSSVTVIKCFFVSIFEKYTFFLVEYDCDL